MVSCASCGYSRTPQHTDSGVTFHTFPKDEKRRAEWIRFVNNPEFIPKLRSSLCSHHFADNCFDRTSQLRVRLHPDAVPTIEVERLKYVKLFNPVITRPVKCEESIFEPSYLSESPNREHIPPPSAKVSVSQPEETPCEKNLKREIDNLQKTNMLKDKKIRHLQKAHWRQRKQISSLKALILDLKNKNLMLEKHKHILVQQFKENEGVVKSRLKKSTNKKLRKSYVKASAVSLNDDIFDDNFLNDHCYSHNCNSLSPYDQENQVEIKSEIL